MHVLSEFPESVIKISRKYFYVCVFLPQVRTLSVSQSSPKLSSSPSIRSNSTDTPITTPKNDAPLTAPKSDANETLPKKVACETSNKNVEKESIIQKIGGKAVEKVKASC